MATEYVAVQFSQYVEIESHSRPQISYALSYMTCWYVEITFIHIPGTIYFVDPTRLSSISLTLMTPKLITEQTVVTLTRYKQFTCVSYVNFVHAAAFLVNGYL